MKTFAVTLVMTGILAGTLLTDASAQNNPNLHDTRDVIGLRVKNAEGRTVGEIDSLMFDAKDAKLTHAVICVGGFLGLGEKHVIVPWSDVKLSMDHNRMVVHVDQSLLERAPRFERRAVTSDRDRMTPATSPAMTPAIEHRQDPQRK